MFAQKLYMSWSYGIVGFPDDQIIGNSGLYVLTPCDAACLERLYTTVCATIRVILRKGFVFSAYDLT